MGSAANTVHREPWNKGKIVGQKAPFKLKDICDRYLTLMAYAGLRRVYAGEHTD